VLTSEQSLLLAQLSGANDKLQQLQVVAGNRVAVSRNKTFTSKKTVVGNIQLSIFAVGKAKEVIT